MRRMFSEKQIKKWIAADVGTPVQIHGEQTIDGKKHFHNDMSFDAYLDFGAGFLTDRLWFGDMCFHLQANGTGPNFNNEFMLSMLYHGEHISYEYSLFFPVPSMANRGKHFALQEDNYSKTEADSRFLIKGTEGPTITARSGWTLWGTIKNIGGNFYYLNVTIRNDTGVAQGYADTPVADIQGNVNDCSLPTACYEAPSNNIGCVIQTNILKFRCGNGAIPNGAYIPISNVIEWVKAS